MSAPAARYSCARPTAASKPSTVRGIGPRHDHEVRVSPRRDGRADLGRHRGRIHQPLAREVAATLGQDLIFQVEAGDSGVLVEADGPLDVDGLAEAGVGVAEDRQRRRAGQHRGLLGELGLGQQADIRQTRPARRECASREINGLEAEPLGHLRHQALNAPGIMIGPAVHAARNRAPGVNMLAFFLGWAAVAAMQMLHTVPCRPGS